jgi:hypothetical protein
MLLELTSGMINVGDYAITMIIIKTKIIIIMITVATTTIQKKEEKKKKKKKKKKKQSVSCWDCGRPFSFLALAFT